MDSLLKLLSIYLRKQHSITNSDKNRDFMIRSVKSVYHVSESTSYLGPKVWEIVSAKIKETNSLNSFKTEIRKWVPQSCPCRLCKQYISGIGFSSLIQGQ